MVDGLAGLVLAGGSSRRFGSDKALAVVDGVTMLDRAVACLRVVCDGPVLVASGDGTSRSGIGDGQVVDLVDGAGPLSAIGAGLVAHRDHSERVAVLAVDHVAPSPDLLQLLASRPGSWSCALAEIDGRLQPLHAVWSAAVADDVAEAVHGGQRSVLDWLAPRDDVAVVGADLLRERGIPLSATADADRPEDLPG